MREIELSAGTIEYEDTGGDGPVPGFNHPALVVWASQDRVMPPEHGQRLAKLLPQGQLAEVEDSYTLIPLDQPARLAQLIREFTPASGTR